MVGDLIARGQPRPERGEGVAAFAFHPLSAALELERALGVIVMQTEARDVIHRVGLIDISRGAPDHEGQLDLPVGFLATAR